MALRIRIESNPETVQDLALASDDKYWEGTELLVAGRRGAGIYLLGYVVEMMLKNACFLIEGARPNDLVGPRLGPIRSWARSFLPGIDPESYHSLMFWAHVLRQKRASVGRHLPRRFDRQLLQRTNRVYENWLVAMRYKPDQALEQEALSVYNDVTWIRDRQSTLVF